VLKGAAQPSRLAVVLKGYPRLSETFIAQEILALERAGLPLDIVSLRHPTDKSVHPVHREIAAPVAYLPEYLHEAPLRVLRAWWRQRRRSGYKRARQAFLRDLRRDRTRNRIRRFGQALVMAEELSPATSFLYAHFLHTPASVTRYAALLTGLPWSCSAHAKDIWLSPDWEKREKLAEMQWLTTCTEVGQQHLTGLAERPDIVHLVYHGLDLRRFPPPPRRDSGEGPVALLSVGRAVEKKGFDDLLEALALLPKDMDWRFRHIGGGAQAQTLKARAEVLGLSDRIEWSGAQPQETVLAAYRAADIFLLASKVAKDGDRDGLPNVLMEAQSQALPCIATALPGIAELIRDGETGLLVPPERPDALAEAIQRLAVDRPLRQRLGTAGQERVRAHFEAEACIGRLLERFAASGFDIAAADAGRARCA